MATSSLTRKARVWAAAIDQVLSSASNGIFTFAVAVASTAQEFGEIVLAITALLSMMVTQRGAVGTPLLLKSDQTAERIHREGSFALLAGLTIGTAVLALVATFGHGVGLPVLLLAGAVPIVLCQDGLRYVTIAEGRPHIAATWDGVWFLGAVVLVVAAWLRLATVPWLVGGWAGLGLVALVGMAVNLRIRPRLDGFGQWARAGWQHRLRYGIDAGFEQTTVFVVLTVVTAMLGPTATAALRGATVLLAPLAILVAALQLVVISESTRNSEEPAAVWSGSLRLTVGIAVLTVGVTVVLCVLPVRVGAYLLGQSFEGAQQVLPIIVVEYLGASLGVALAGYLKTFNRSSDILRLKIASFAVTLTAAVCAVLLFHSARGVAVGLAVGTILVISLGLAIYAPWEVRARASSVDIAVGD